MGLVGVNVAPLVAKPAQVLSPFASNGKVGLPIRGLKSQALIGHLVSFVLDARSIEVLLIIENFLVHC